MKDGKISTKDGIVNRQLFRETHWIANVNENSFDCFGCPPPNL